MAKASKGRPLVVVGRAVVDVMDLVKKCNINPQKFGNFLHVSSLTCANDLNQAVPDSSGWQRASHTYSSNPSLVHYYHISLHNLMHVASHHLTPQIIGPTDSPCSQLTLPPPSLAPSLPQYTEGGYQPAVYHNSTHAADVTQTTCAAVLMDKLDTTVDPANLL